MAAGRGWIAGKMPPRGSGRGGRLGPGATPGIGTRGDTGVRRAPGGRDAEGGAGTAPPGERNTGGCRVRFAALARLSPRSGAALAALAAGPALFALGCSKHRETPPSVSTTVPSPLDAALPSGAPTRDDPFKLIAEGRWKGIALHSLDGAVIVADADGPIGLVRGNRFDVDASLAKGLPPFVPGLFHSFIAGRWPDNAWAAVDRARDRNGDDVDSLVYRWTNDRWVEEQKYRKPSRCPTGLTPWTDDRMLLTRRIMGRGFIPTGPADIEVLGGKPGAPAPRRSPPLDPCSSGFNVDTAISALPSGEIFLLGRRCDPRTLAGPDDLSTGLCAVERWPQGQRQPVVDVLPGPSVSEGDTEGWRLIVRSAAEAYVFGDVKPLKGEEQAVVWRFDGAAWNSEVLPPSLKVLVGVGVDREGTLWAAPAGAVWRRRAGQGWAPVELPMGWREADGKIEVRGIVVQADGGVWVAVEKEGGQVGFLHRGAER